MLVLCRLPLPSTLFPFHPHKREQCDTLDKGEGCRGRQWAHKSGRAGSSTRRTLSTAMGDSSEEYWLTTLLLSDLQPAQAIQCIKHSAWEASPASAAAARIAEGEGIPASLHFSR